VARCGIKFLMLACWPYNTNKYSWIQADQLDDPGQQKARNLEESGLFWTSSNVVEL
jgi:hypothetical protein